MPFRIERDATTGLVVTRVEGLVTFEDIYKHLDEEASLRMLAWPEVIDTCGASTNLTSEEVRHLVSRLTGTMKTEDFGPTAIIATNNTLFGMARMLGILSEMQGGPLIEAFRTFNEGLDWLRSLSKS